MANRYANLTGTNRISEEYELINEGFDAVQSEMDANKATATAHINNSNIHVTTTDKSNWNSKAPGNHSHPNATETTPGFMSAADKAKLDDIEEGAEANQNAFSRVNGMNADNPLDSFTIAAGTGIDVTINPNTKTINITATGESTPGAHASSHLEDGSDPIALATPTTGGLMSAEDKTKLNKLKAPPWTWADLEGGS